jgi:outer membrane protein OmpA-like peptidoglycan-associated protein
VAKLKQESRNAYITIEGHTDYMGSSSVNEKIGLERARAVEQYLYEEHRIPLHKMEVISYGGSEPGCAEHDARRPSRESPGRDQGPVVIGSTS